MSMIGYVEPSNTLLVCSQLTDIEGIEVAHVTDENTKILFLLDLEDELAFHNALKKIQEIKSLYSISYAAHYSEEAINQET